MSIKNLNLKDLLQLVLDLQQNIVKISHELGIVGQYIDSKGMRVRLEELKLASHKENLWDDPKHAGQLLKELATYEQMINKFDSNLKDLESLKELINETLKSSYTDDEISLLVTEAKRIGDLVNTAYIETLFTSEDDDLPCFIEIKAGVGGLEAQDWAEMLFDMYQKFAMDNYKMEIIDYCPKDVGIDSATIKISGAPKSFPYGMLKGETGTHRLVRPSPYNKNNKRHTSFAEVFVSPAKDTHINIEIAEKDIRIDTYRASGAGGQHVNRTDSAVRITHIPTGIVAQCQNDRSQHKNKAEAMKLLKIKLYAEEEKKRVADTKRKGPGGWGQQIRSYVLDDSRITDLRTNFESYQPAKVLNGDLMPFLHAYVNFQVNQQG